MLYDLCVFIYPFLFANTHALTQTHMLTHTRMLINGYTLHRWTQNDMEACSPPYKSKHTYSNAHTRTHTHTQIEREREGERVINRLQNKRIVFPKHISTLY